MTLSHVTALPLLALSLMSLDGCATAAGPAQPRVMLVQDDEFVLTGTTDPTTTPTKSGCTAGTPKHYLKLVEPLKAKLTLRGTNGAAPLTGAMMSLTNVDSHATVCAAMRDDGTPAVIPAQLDIGTYAIAVSGDQPPRRYEILWEQR